MNSESKNIDVGDLRSRAEDIVRDRPAEAAGVALLAGFILALLPLGAVLMALIRLALHLVKPALMILGLMKVYEGCCGSCGAGADQ